MGILKVNSKNNLNKASTKPTFKEEWNKGISVEDLRVNLLKKVHTRWNEKLVLAKTN